MLINRGNMDTSEAKIRLLFYKSDPLTNLVRKILGLSPGNAAITISLILNVPIIALSFIYDIWTIKNNVGLSNDYGWWVYQIIGVPATLYFFFWMPDGIYDVFNGLRNNKVIINENLRTRSEKKYYEFINEYSQILSSKFWVLIAFCIVTLLMIFAVIPEQKKFVGWLTVNNVVFIYHAFFWYIIFLIGSLMLIKILVTLYWFNLLFKNFEVDVRVLHPDKSGGLSPLSNFSLKIGYMIGIFGLTTITTIWSQSSYLTPGKVFSLYTSPATISLGVAYILIAPLVFFAPIGSAHSAMKKAKNDYIISISDQFKRDFTNIQLLLNKDSKNLKSSLEKIEYLQKIHEMASKFPVWPFNTSSIIIFFSSVFSPFILSILPSIILQLLFAN